MAKRTDLSAFAAIATLYVLSLAGCNPSATSIIEFETFVVEDASVRIGFNRPKNATEGTAGSLDSNLAVVFTPPAGQAGVFVNFSAARGESGTALSIQSAKSLKATTSTEQSDVVIGGHSLQRTMFRSQSPEGAVYEGGDVQGTAGDRYIFLRCSFKVRDANGKSPDGRESEYRKAIGVILDSLHIEGRD